MLKHKELLHLSQWSEGRLLTLSARLILVFQNRYTVMASNGTQNGVHDKDFEHLDSRMDEDTALRKIQTAGSISISPELFEKIYLSPQNQVKGDIRKTFGNPTPM
jgi:hypothetical protein